MSDGQAKKRKGVGKKGEVYSQEKKVWGFVKEVLEEQ